VPSSKFLRPLAAVAAVACTVSLAGCGSSSKKDTTSGASSSPSPSATTAANVNPCEVKPGSASAGVKVSGAFGKKATATFTKPLKSDGLQRTVLTKGTGVTPKDGQTVNAIVTAYLGSGKALGTSPLKLAIGSTSIPVAFRAGLSCLPIGSRTVVTDTAGDIYGASGNPNIGAKADDSLVIVTDLVSIVKPLKPASWTQNRATVTFDKTGKPTVKLPKTKPPAQLQLQVLKPGKGAVVKSGDQVTLDYQGTSWNTGKIFDQSYGRSPATFATDQVVEGFGAALVGQKVGTTLIVSIPPKYAYGTKGSGQQLAGQTLVFVINIGKTGAAAAAPAQ
jgi:peptidylprolyl isomerase